MCINEKLGRYMELLSFDENQANWNTPIIGILKSSEKLWLSTN